MRRSNHGRYPVRITGYLENNRKLPVNGFTVEYNREEIDRNIQERVKNKNWSCVKCKSSHECSAYKQTLFQKAVCPRCYIQKKQHETLLNMIHQHHKEQLSFIDNLQDVSTLNLYSTQLHQVGDELYANMCWTGDKYILLYS